jgi:hypothetical protein
MKWKLPAIERILVPCGSIIGRFHCITLLKAKVQLLVHFLPTPTAIYFFLRRKIVVKLDVNILLNDMYNACLGGNNGNQTISWLLL